MTPNRCGELPAARAKTSRRPLIRFRFVRDTHKPTAEWEKHGQEVFEAVYGDTASSVLGLLDAAYPDLGLPRLPSPCVLATH